MALHPIEKFSPYLPQSHQNYLLLLPTRVINVTTAERSMEKAMSTIDSENISKPEAQPKVRRKPAKKAKAAKKAPQVKKAAGKPKSDGTNKKAEVITMMKRVPAQDMVNPRIAVPLP